VARRVDVRAGFGDFLELSQSGAMGERMGPRCVVGKGKRGDPDQAAHGARGRLAHVVEGLWRAACAVALAAHDNGGCRVVPERKESSAWAGPGKIYPTFSQLSV
jgi:hypothetical protein